MILLSKGRVGGWGLEACMYVYKSTPGYRISFQAVLQSNLFQVPLREELRELIVRFQIFDETLETVPDETGLNTTACSVASSGYEGDEEDIEEMLDSDDEMLWYEEGCEGAPGVPNPKETPRDAPEVMSIERSTPSFLSPSWFQDVVNQSGMSSNRSVSLGSHTSRQNSSHGSCNSVGASSTPSSVHSRRPLMDINYNRQHRTSSGNTNTQKAQAQFRPINMTPTYENMDI